MDWKREENRRKENKEVGRMGNNGNRARLEDKIAMVTGGSRGIGRAIALRLAEEGADVAINYQNTKANAENVSKLINQMGTIEELGKLSIILECMDTREQGKEYRNL